ncbi:hypothetical protein COLO4_15483 [Corchorus olitorius]|uniref:Uncharacterized protein n=1 Tax=Corchorus olitorius TaxID=93759 RepID=A0A1R3JMY4_9ROSI|nr:hypothetical protein COLO4_15483 [Corchorus olitorius]
MAYKSGPELHNLTKGGIRPKKKKKKHPGPRGKRIEHNEAI